MTEANGDEIVGFKCPMDGTGCQGLTRAEADAIIKACDEARDKRAADMPDEQAAINAMFQAYQRLKELGWREAIYCPKDGTSFDAIEPGSTGIHTCSYSGKWPKGSWWVHNAGDLWPSRPCLFKPKSTTKGQ